MTIGLQLSKGSIHFLRHQLSFVRNDQHHIWATLMLAAELSRAFPDGEICAVIQEMSEKARLVDQREPSKRSDAL